MERIESATLEDAIEIAASAHKGQVDKAGNAYITHPLRMMFRVKSINAMIVAVLHDVVEDTHWTFGALREKGFSEEVLEALDCVTERDGESYDDFIKRVAENETAIEVKIADLEDNMNIRRINQMQEKDLKRLAKYHKHWKFLTNLVQELENKVRKFNQL